jgi:hypothetical protein
VAAGPRRGRLRAEPLCSDIPDPVESVTAQVVTWQGLLAMSRVWADTGRPQLSRRARRLAVRLERALRPAVRASMVRMRDGSLFVPATLSTRSGPHESLTF